MNLDEEKLAFFYEIGAAAAEWAKVEFALMAVNAACFSYGDMVKANAGYVSIENFRSKLQFLDAAFRSHKMHDQEMKNWAVLHDRTYRASQGRNKAAHYFAICMAKGSQAGRRFMLIPMKPTRAAKRPKGQKIAGAIFLRDIATLRLEFAALSAALENFADRLRGDAERNPKSHEQAQRSPTLPDLRRAIYSLARTPPRLSRE